MARGWGKSEEDLGAEKEHAREAAEKAAARPSRAHAEKVARRRSLELSLARIEDLLRKTENPARRSALEAARAELLERAPSASPSPPARDEGRDLERQRDSRARSPRSASGSRATGPTPCASRRSRRSPSRFRRCSSSPRATGATGTARAATRASRCTVRKELCPERPAFAHPEFDHETRIVTADVGGVTVASVYVPNGGKDYAAKLRFLEALGGWARRRAATAGRELHPLRRPERRADRPGRPPQGAEGRRRRPARGRAGAHSRGSSAHGLVDVGRALDPDNDGPLHLVGALAQHPPAQHRLADRLHPGERGAGPAGRGRASSGPTSARATTRPSSRTSAAAELAVPGAFSVVSRRFANRIDRWEVAT